MTEISSPYAPSDGETSAALPILSRVAILKHTQLQRELVEVPEWGGAVYVREMTGAERATLELDHRDAGNMARNYPNVRAKIAAWCVLDAAGARLFGEKDVADLADTSAAALDRILAVVRRLSGMADPETRTKNSVSGQSSDSGTN